MSSLSRTKAPIAALLIGIVILFVVTPRLKNPTLKLFDRIRNALLGNINQNSVSGFG